MESPLSLLFTCSLIFSFTPSASAQTHRAWARDYVAAPSGISSAYAAAVAGSGSVYAVGNTGSYDALVLKYDPTGTLAWAHTFALGPNIDYANGVVVDPSSEDIYVFGRGDTTHNSSGFVCKYDSSGNLLWSTGYPASGPIGAEFTLGLLRPNGDLVVTGFSGNLGTVVVEYDPLGNLVWNAAAPGDAYPADMTLDGQGNTIIAGTYDDNAGTTQFGVSKFSATGTFLWTSKVFGGGTGNEGAFGVVTDSSGMIYAGGRLFATGNVAVSAVVKLDPAGNLVWGRRRPGTQSSPYLYDEGIDRLALAPNGNVRAVGRTADVGSGRDIQACEYTPSGVLAWEDTWNGPWNDDDSPNSIQTEGDGSLTVLGTSEDAVGHYNPVVLRWDAHGNFQWATVDPQSGPSNAYGNSVSAFGPQGVCVFVGHTPPSGGTIHASVIEELEDVVTFCFGDGNGTACPCGNNGTTGNGCANSLNANGSNLAASGVASVSADSLVLTGSGMPNSSCLYFQGTTQTSAVFGDGLRCAGGSTIRLGTKANSAGSSQYPAAGDPSVSARGFVPVGGGTRTYQVWYRNVASFCTSSTFNLTNGVLINWQS